jgi:GT2 family glycosyltransferase
MGDLMGDARFTESQQRQLQETAREGYEQAARAVGEQRYAFAIAGGTVRLRFAGPALVPLITRALAHLRLDEPPPEPDPRDLEVCVWDSASTGIAMSPPPCGQRHFTGRGNIWGFDSERYRSAFHWGEFSLNAMDTAERRAVFWVDNAANLPFWVPASPLRSILHWWVGLDGRHLIHAAVVGTPEAAVLIPGRGGAGKSTTALLALRHGLRYLSDDYAVVQLDPEPRAFGLYSTAKLEPDQLARFPELAAHAQLRPAMGCEKVVAFLHPAFSSQLTDSLPLRAVLLPRISGQPQTALVHAEALALEHAARFTTTCQLPHTGQATAEFMHRVATGLPRAGIELGTRLDEIPAMVAACAQGDPPFARVARRGPDVERATPRDWPLLSAVIPVHNGAKFVREAIDSVLAQKYPRLELIVVDDGSTDDTRKIVEGLGLDLCYHEFLVNQGPAEARNRGIREAAGDFIAFLDVDDLWPEDMLHRLLTILLSQPELQFVRGRAQVLELDAASGAFRPRGTPRDSFPHYIGAALYRASAFRRVGPFDPRLRFGEDSDWFMRASEIGLAGRQLDEVTLYVRRHGDNMTWRKNQVELNCLRVLKHALERRRERERDAGEAPRG